MTGTRRLTTSQAADVLGVRPATVYAYVSRGVLSRQSAVTGSGQRISLFDRAEVLRLAELRARPRAGAIEVLVESDITQLDPRGELRYRGRDVKELALSGCYEDAVAVLWQQPSGPWPAPDPALMQAAATLQVTALDAAPDRIRAAVVAASAADPDRADISAEHVLWTARNAIQLAVASVRPPEPRGEGVAEALWHAFTGQRAGRQQRETLDAALVVLLDHELTASTLATRIAAGLHCDPWMALLSGLSTMSGLRQAGALPAALRQLDGWVAGRRLGEHIAGFGHRVYEGVDPRASVLLDLVESLDPALMRCVESLISEVAVQHSVLPNVDLGLAAVVRALGLPDEAAETLFMIGRIAGLAAHAVEEYPHRLRFRPRSLSG